MIRFNWDETDLRLGFWFALVTLAIMGLGQFREATWITAGLSALLAWVPLLLLDYRHLRSGVTALATYVVLGAALSVLGHLVAPYEVGRILAVGAVALVAGLSLQYGLFCYLFAFVLLFWFVLTPLFSTSVGLSDTLEGHFVGSVGLLLFWSIRRALFDGASWHDPLPPFGKFPMPLSWKYAGVLSAVMMMGTGVGGRILTSDPTLIAQASLNIVAPSVDMTLQAGLGRMLFGLGGLLMGFYLGLFFPSVVLFQFVVALGAFVGLAFLRVNIGFLVWAFAFIFAFPMGSFGVEEAHASGNERLLAEGLGIALACVAIFALGRARQYASEED